MKYKILIPGIIVLCLFTLFLQQAMTQEETRKADHLTLFSNQERPAPAFDHTLHEDSLGDTGCAKCHHVLDIEQNKLIYAEGEEAACSECHTSEQSDNILAMREASHASCTGCHREMKKGKKTAGPTTCGECHRK
ncbi:MAG: cytochrome c family protein [Proteobacteria bacterium]|nr:cytochrome c family protein [Pseudomonadota bacterium]